MLIFSYFNVELETSVSEISSVSIIRVGVMDEYISLLFIPVYRDIPVPEISMFLFPFFFEFYALLHEHLF
jgi:hypothetical protein